MNNFRYIAFLSVFGTLTLFWLVDKREVKLLHVGTIEIQPPTKNLPCSITVSKGDEIRSVIVEIEDWLQNDGKKHKIGPLRTKINPSTIYYLGVGCKINKISYFYHSKYTNALGNPNYYAIHSSTLIRDDPGKVNIYSADVFASDINK